MWLVDSVYDFASQYPRLTIAVGSCTAFVLYYLVEVVKIPKFECGRKQLGGYLLQKCPSLRQKFWATPYCFTAFAQTLLAYFSKEILPVISYTREILTLDDGGQVSLDWLETDESRTNGTIPTVLHLAGLTGDSQVNYVKSMVLQTHNLGYRTVVFNNRGRGGVQLLTPKAYSGADYDDLRQVVHYIKKKLPESPLLATGSSYGGVILGQYVIGMGEDTGLEGAFLLSTPYDFMEGLKNMERQPFNIRLNKYLVSYLLDDVRRSRKFWDDQLNIDLVLKSKTLREFEANFTSKLNGFKTLDDYYDRISLRDKLKAVKVPVVSVNASDDPFQPSSSLPTLEDFEGSAFSLVLAARGGHLGFLQGFNIFKESFSERLFREFCHAILESDEWKYILCSH